MTTRRADARKQPITDLNAARKRRAGHRDIGLCACGLYYRVSCRDGCLDPPPAKETEP